MTTSNLVYRVAGGAPIPISSCQYLNGCQGEVLVDQYAIDNHDHLNTVPTDGTVLEGEPSGQFWLYSSGCVATTSLTTGAVAVTDDAVAAFASCATVPGAPTSVVATAGNATAHLTWAAPGSNGGSAITNYQVTPFIGTTGQTPVLTGSTATSFTVTGLSNGTTYTFKVAAVNSIGTGANSAASNAVIPSTATAPGVPTGLSATAGVGSTYLTWTAPSDGGSAITGYRITPSAGSSVLTGSTATTFAFSGLSSASSYTFQVAAINAFGTGANSSASSVITPLPGGTYYPLVPARILDTRTAIGVPARPAGPLGAGQTLNLQVTGQGGVPASGVSSVVLNVTVTNTTAGSYLTVWPTGVAQPVVSNLNWTPGKTVANLVEVQVGPTGMVSIYNPLGSTDVIADVQGYVGDNTDSYTRAGLFNSLTPVRLLDTRTGVGGPAVRLAPGEVRNLTVTNIGGVPATGAAAVVLNVTAVTPSAGGYLTVWPTGASQPTASNLNFLAGQIVPNRVIVKVGTNGQVSIYNPAGYTDVVADVGGWFTDITSTAGGSAFISEVPFRIFDTRNTGGPIGPGGVLILPPSPSYSTPHTALVLNVTAVTPTMPGYLTLYPDSGTSNHTPPAASDLNFVPGEIVPNLTIVKLGPDLQFDTYNPAGSTQVVYDEDGYYGSAAPAPPVWAVSARN